VNASAEGLFDDVDRCTNGEAGYSLSFPDAWYTNTATGDTPPCSWFTPEYFEVEVAGSAPDEIWIEVAVVDATVGYTSLTEVFYREDIELDGRDGRRVEFNPQPTDDPALRAYHYVIPLGDAGPTFVALTDNRMADDYELAKAVLDRLMASLALGD
jgi:hypothetical protein